MPLNAPLQVQLSNAGNSVRSITRDLIDDVSYGSSVPGGFTTMGCKLSRPLELPNNDLSAYTTVRVVDTRSGEIVWSGRLEDPGRASSGEVWQLGAVGGATHAKDVSKPVIYNDTRGSVWRRREERTLPSATFSNNGSEQSGGGETSMLYSFPRGTTLPTNGRSVSIYDLLLSTGQHLARCESRVTGGRALSTLNPQIVGRGGPAADAVLHSLNLSTSEQTLIARLGTTMTTLHTAPELRFLWSGTAGTVVGDDVTWMEARGTRVQGTRLTQLGVEIVTGYSTVYNLPHEIVADVLGRFTPEWDRAQAAIDTSSSVHIDQMAYDDGATADQILSDLMALAPTHYWAAWEDNGNGARFEWAPWPTQIALGTLNTNRDAFDSPQSAADLYNEVAVRYKDPNGNTATLVRTGTVPALDAAGLTRRGQLDLGSQLGTATAAADAGDAFLAAHQYPTNTGTIKVSRPLSDAVGGRTLQPWQLKAGVLCRVGNLYPRPDALNESADGSTVFRVSEVSYSAKSNEATLTLDSYNRTVARALAGLAKRTDRTRRL